MLLSYSRVGFATKKNEETWRPMLRLDCPFSCSTWKALHCSCWVDFSLLALRQSWHFWMMLSLFWALKLRCITLKDVSRHGTELAAFSVRFWWMAQEDKGSKEKTMNVATWLESWRESPLSKCVNARISLNCKTSYILSLGCQKRYALQMDVFTTKKLGDRETEKLPPDVRPMIQLWVWNRHQASVVVWQ